MEKDTLDITKELACYVNR